MLYTGNKLTNEVSLLDIHFTKQETQLNCTDRTHEIKIRTRYEIIDNDRYQTIKILTELGNFGYAIGITERKFVKILETFEADEAPKRNTDHRQVGSRQ